MTSELRVSNTVKGRFGHGLAGRSALLGATALTALGLFPAGAMAQQANKQIAAAETTTLGEIVVQARRRSETIVDVPIAISVVTDQMMQQLDLSSTTDLANFTPGLVYNNFTAGDARNDRGADRPIILRGLNLGIGGSAGANLFLNGAYVAGGEVPASMDVGQVEILRGPQSVFFGRSTLTGAVSYRTRPIGDKWGAELEVKVAEQGERNIEATVAGPIIPGVLKVRLTGLTQEYGGYVTNDFNNGASELGATSRDSISTTVLFTPIEAVELKAYVNYFRDDDGPAATAFITPNYANCRFPNATRMTICGEIPDHSLSTNYSNTVIPTNIADVIFSTPLIKDADFDRKIGQQRKAFNSDLVAGWQINDYLKLETITGYHDNVTLSASDGLSRPSQPGFTYANYMYTYTVKRKDFSQEVRLSSDPERRLSWTLGANYVRQTQSISAYVGWISRAGAFTNFKQAIVPNTAKTIGVFGGAYFKITDDLTLSAETRRQSDKILIPGNQAKFDSWSPRIALDYNVGGGRKVYTSYAEGTTPGGFNTSVSQYKNNPVAFPQIQALLGISSDSFKEQVLKIAEVGFKGHFDGGKGYFDINAYSGELTNQQLRNSQLIPALGFTVSVTNNAGESKIHGIEFQGNYNFNDNLSLATTYAWNHTERVKYFNVSGIPQFGTTTFDGKKFAFVPEYSGSAVVSYTHDLTDSRDWFANGALIYRGRQYADDYNAAYIPQRYQVDVRGGLSNETYRVELFVKNLLDDQNYTGGGVTGDFGTDGSYSFFGGWAPPRQIGMRVGAKF